MPITHKETINEFEMQSLQGYYALNCVKQNVVYPQAKVIEQLVFGISAIKVFNWRRLDGLPVKIGPSA